MVFAERYEVGSLMLKKLLEINPNYKKANWLNQEQKCIRSFRYKYIWSSSGEDEFYDLHRDADESNNIIGNIGSQEIGQMKSKYKEKLSELKIRTSKPSHEDIDPILKQRLKDLGYID